MIFTRQCFFLFLLLLFTFNAKGQKVGLVLSGGGADAVAHVGVIKALEEHGIPIDYVTGASMGALVGSLYASGYSPDQLEHFFTSPNFSNMSRGIVERKDIFYYQEIEEDASLLRLKFSNDSTFKAQLPTNLIDPASIDLELAQALSPANIAANEDFDQLMIPFRCVASDISLKELVVFSSGNLSDAVRASMSYPFYLKPIYIDGVLLFDGGLYNNFPVDLMCSDFNPDFIIGSSVATSMEPPNDQDPFSQIKNMMVSKTIYNIDCQSGVVINPNSNNGTFNFSKAEAAIDSGYAATIRNIDIIKQAVSRKIDTTERQAIRNAFNEKKSVLKYDSLSISGLSDKQEKYIRNTIGTINATHTLDSASMHKGFFKLHGDSKIKNIYPRISKSTDSSYAIHLKIEREKDLILSVGGNLSTNPINHVFLSAQYNRLKNTGLTLYANGYYGRLYAGTKALARIDIPSKIAFYLQPSFTIQRWNYYRSRNFFFEEFRPSYLIQNEQFASLTLGAPVTNKGKIELDVTAFHLFDDYYQTQSFSPTDTADKTFFDGYSTSFLFENNTLNDRQYATSGSRLRISAKYVNGREFHDPGSTSSQENEIKQQHNWYQLNLQYQTYYKNTGKLRLGLSLSGLYTNQPLFSNYTSSILRAQAFQPTPESKTLFLETFRANQFVTLGHKFIFNISPQVHFRLEGYIFQPYQMLTNGDNSKAELEKPWTERYTIATATGVWRTPVGPLSLGLNYYHNVPEVTLESTTPLTLLLNFGYIIFNKKALY